jgi:hypothetical protein
MFDKGIYLADMSSKSANYCCSYNSGGQALLLLCDAELGNPMQVLTNAQYDAGKTAAQKGAISTWGQGTTAPKGLKDASALHPSLTGVKMVITILRMHDCGIYGLLTDNRLNSPTRRKSRAIQMSPTLACSTTSSSATMSLRCACATCCA